MISSGANFFVLVVSFLQIKIRSSREIWNLDFEPTYLGFTGATGVCLTTSYGCEPFEKYYKSMYLVNMFILSRSTAPDVAMLPI
jgi:hypothetical protein